MSDAAFIGLTWDHPRGYEALDAAARRVAAGRAEPLLAWRRQPLEGFESAPIAALAAAHDLLVLDHPHVGEAVASECLLPLESLYPAERLDAWRRDSVGPSFESYRYEGLSWAVPLDVAAQVTARRPDRIATPPESWDEIERLARELPVALSLGGPHALLTLLSMVAGVGPDVCREDFLPEENALVALERLHRLWALRAVDSEHMNPIGLLETMARGNAIALVPLVFGYVTYAVPGEGRQRIAFSGTPREGAGFGGVLGGTGIGFSRRCTPTPGLLEHVGWLMSRSAQVEFLPRHGGQPSARAAWEDGEVNDGWGGFYRDTLESVERALLRPRFAGYVSFQNRASARVREALHAGEAPETTLEGLRCLWRAARAASVNADGEHIGHIA